jgi:hypothetical protein
MNVKLTCPEHGIHDPWMPRTTRGLAIAGLDDRDIYNLLREATRNARRPVPDNEIRDTIATIRGTKRGGLNVSSEAPPAFEPAFLEETAARIPHTVDAGYLEARSQFTCWNRTPAGFLHKIFRPGENVWITTNDKSSDGILWTYDKHGQRFDELAHVETGQHSVWYLTNPVDAQLHALVRRQSEHNPEGLTFRAVECVTGWRHMLIESAEAPADLWLKALVQFEIPIIAIYHSGKRSYHALVRFNAKSKEHWDELCKQRREQMIRLGACDGSLTALRLSRLPNCVRGETGKPQQLLYLSPDADSTPICKRPVREPADALEKRIRETHAGTIHNYETPDL